MISKFMPIANKLKNAYYQGGVKEVFYGAFHLGSGKVINIISPSISENKILRSEDILDGTTKVTDYVKLPTKGNLAPLQQSESRNPFNEMKDEAEFLQSYQYSYRPSYIYEMEDVRLLGPKGIGITKDGTILEDSITMPRQERIETSIQESYKYHPLLTMETLYTARRSSDENSQTLDCACSLFSGWNNYYHWILEHLSKLRGIEYYKAKTGTQPTFIIPNDPPSYIHDTLELLDIKSSNCLEWQSPAIDVKNLVLPSYPEANPENLHWLRTNLRSSIQEEVPYNIPNRIYISREKAPKRRVKNESEVLNLVNDFGFERVFAEDLSIKSQIRLFSKANKIIGPHGAGLTNMIWGDEMTIIEIHNDYIRDHYSVLANNLGHRYIPIQGDSTQPTELNSNIIVDVDRLEAALSGCTSR